MGLKPKVMSAVVGMNILAHIKEKGIEKQKKNKRRGNMPMILDFLSHAIVPNGSTGITEIGC